MTTAICDLIQLDPYRVCIVLVGSYCIFGFKYYENRKYADSKKFVLFAISGRMTRMFHESITRICIRVTRRYGRERGISRAGGVLA